MAFITSQQFDDVVDVALSLPATRLEGGSAKVVATIGVAELRPVSIALLFLQLRCLAGKGGASLACFLDYDQDSPPSSQDPIGSVMSVQGPRSDVCTGDLITGSAQISTQPDPSSFVLTVGTTGAGAYSWVVWPNSTTVTVAVTGSARVNCNPA